MMRCVGLYQPHATLAAIAEKRIETRGWRVWHRGELAIYATKSFPPENRAFCLAQPVLSILGDHGFARRANREDKQHATQAHTDDGIVLELPHGCVIAVAELVEILPIVAPAGRMFDYDIFEMAEKHMALHGHPEWRPGSLELAFGDYSDGRYAWLLASVRKLAQPVPARGYQGMWKLKPHEEALVRASLGMAA